MKILTPFVALLIVISIISLLLTTATTTNFVHASIGFANCSRSFINGFIPSKPGKDVEVCRDGAIAISYNGEWRVPSWSAYYVTPQNIKDHISGRDSFYEDPDLKQLDVPQASPRAEVWSSEWNRGHLAPSSIMSWSEDTKYATYTCANIAPQWWTFNQQSWRFLEEDIFNWVGDNNALYIVTGTAVDESIGPQWGPDHEVVKPTYYWKAICDPSKNQSAAFYGFNAEYPPSMQANKEGRRMNTAQDRSFFSQSSPSLGVTMENFLTVDELTEKITKSGKIFPWSHCKTSEVDQSYWGWSTENYGSINIKAIQDRHPRAREVLRELHLENKRLFQKKEAHKKEKKFMEKLHQMKKN